MSFESTHQQAPRIHMADDGPMDEAQQKVYDKIVRGKRGKIVAPFRALLHSPELADRSQLLGEFVRYETSLPEMISELAILCIGRYWNCRAEWSIHANIAREAGLSKHIVEAILKAEVPPFEEPLQIAVYEFTREMLENAQVSDNIYQNAQNFLGTKALIELTGIIGYYTYMAMTLNAHHVPFEDGGNTSFLEFQKNVDTLKPTRLPAAITNTSSENG